jgi:hypothetical protein
LQHGISIILCNEKSKVLSFLTHSALRCLPAKFNFAQTPTPLPAATATQNTVETRKAETDLIHQGD